MNSNDFITENTFSAPIPPPVSGNLVENIAIMINTETKSLVIYEPGSSGQDACATNQIATIPFGNSIAVYMNDGKFYWEQADSVKHRIGIKKDKISGIFSQTGAKLYKKESEEEWDYIIIGEEDIRDGSVNDGSGVNLSFKPGRKVFFQIEKIVIGESVQYNFWIYSTKQIITSFDSSYEDLCD